MYYLRTYKTNIFLAADSVCQSVIEIMYSDWVEIWIGVSQLDSECWKID